MWVFTVASDEELAARDLGVGQPAGGEREDLPLALGEGRRRPGGTGARRGAAKCANRSRVAEAAITASIRSARCGSPRAGTRDRRP